MTHLIICVAIVLAVLACIMIRPGGLSEAWVALGGAVLLLAGGYLSIGEIPGILARQANVFGFFLGLMTIAALADQAGVFDLLATLIARWASGSTFWLYAGIFALGTLITMFLSNDATALILTPIVYALVTRLRLPVLPFMFACTFIADTASFLLPVSNPTNILVLDALGHGLLPFLHYLLLPALTCVGINVAIFLLVFRRSLRLRYAEADLEAIQPDSPLRRYTLFSLGIIAVGYVIASALQVSLALVALGGGALMFFGAMLYKQLDWKRLGREISWSLFVFIAGLFLIVQAVEQLGILTPLSRGIVHVAASGSFLGVLSVAAGGAVGSNLINNIPMTLVLISAFHGAPQVVSQHPALIYATILGVDLGPNLTTVGSLATMLWLVLLRRKGLDITTLDYVKLGLLIIPAMLIVSSLEIWLRW
ncbi:MAG: ArsB/NhaD family transporter [Thermacetogeniaceae bacterium]